MSHTKLHRALLPTVILFVVCALSIQAAAQDKYAVVVGVETYDTSLFNNLDYSADDAQALGKALDKLGFAATVMTSDAASSQHRPSTPRKILRAIDSVAASCAPGDTLVISLSGHGVQFSDEVVERDKPKDTYFCPGDADLSDKESLLKISAVVEALKGARASRKLLLIDACREEVLSPEGKSKTARKIDLGSVHETKRSVPSGMAVLFSCKSDQFSWEHKPLGHSVFTYHVINYVAGRADSRYYDQGEVELNNLVAYVSKRTNDYVRENNLSHAQVPVLRTQDDTANWSLGRVRVISPIAPGLTLTKAEKRARIAKAKRELPELKPVGSEKELAWCYAKMGDLEGVLRVTRLPSEPPESHDDAIINTLLERARALRMMSLSDPRRQILDEIRRLTEYSRKVTFGSLGPSHNDLLSELRRRPHEPLLADVRAQLGHLPDNLYVIAEDLRPVFALVPEAEIRKEFAPNRFEGYDLPIAAAIVGDYELAVTIDAKAGHSPWAVAALALRGDVQAAIDIAKAAGDGKLTAPFVAVLADTLESNDDAESAQAILRAFRGPFDGTYLTNGCGGEPRPFNHFGGCGTGPVTRSLFITVGRIDAEAIYRRLADQLHRERSAYSEEQLSNGVHWHLPTEEQLRFSYLLGMLNDL